MPDTQRIDRLVAQFNGAIKYAPMLQDHPEWTDEQCLAFAREWHAKAMEGLRRAVRIEQAGWEPVERQHPRWNNKIPYVRNLPTPEMLREAGR